jgi:D-alanyl-D-alanine dipeptidase
LRGESQRALARVPIRDNGEPLVDFLQVCPQLRFAVRHPVFEYERARLAREGVAERLCQAQALLPAGYTLEIVEGWRSPAIQQMMYETTYREFRERHPEWSESSVRRATNRFSAPADPRVPPPHTTGGAIDLSLVGPDGAPVDMVSPFSPYDRRSAAMATPRLVSDARHNRDILAQSLTAAGFSNYPPEWWHWSYGDQAWALRTDRDFAIYGMVAPPQERP